jgi:hypothetical protein
MVGSDLPATEAASFLFWLRFELNLLNRFAFAATRFRYRRLSFRPKRQPPDLSSLQEKHLSFHGPFVRLHIGRRCHPHQFHHPERYNAICLGCQHHQRSEHPRIGPANRLVTENLGASF